MNCSCQNHLLISPILSNINHYFSPPLKVERATANEQHAFSRFSTGNKDTLAVDGAANASSSRNGKPEGSHNLRYELYTFFKANYSANLMTVCLLHNESLERMEEVAKEHFLRISNKNIPETIWPNRPFRPSQMKTKIYVVPVKVRKKWFLIPYRSYHYAIHHVSSR